MTSTFSKHCRSLLVMTCLLLACSCVMEARIDARGRLQDEPSRTPFDALFGRSATPTSSQSDKSWESDIPYFEMKVRRSEKNLLLRVLWMESPYPGYFHVLSVYRSGDVVLIRDVPEWARQGVWETRLDKSVLTQIELQTRGFRDLNKLSVSTPNRKLQYVGLAYFDGATVQQHFFVGSLPVDVENTVHLIEGLMLADHNALDASESP